MTFFQFVYFVISTKVFLYTIKYAFLNITETALYIHLKLWQLLGEDFMKGLKTSAQAVKREK